MLDSVGSTKQVSSPPPAPPADPPKTSSARSDPDARNARAGMSQAQNPQENLGPGLREAPASRDLQRGESVRAHARAETNANTGDIRVDHGHEHNIRTPDGNISVSRDTTHAANVYTGNTMYGTNERVSIETPNARYERETQYREYRTNGNTAPNNGTPPERDQGGVKPEFNVVQTEGSREVSVASASASGEHGSIKVSALGAEAKGQASAGFGAGTVRAEAAGSAGVYVAKVEAELHAGPASAKGEAQVGAEAEGAAEVEFDPLKGDLNASAEAGAFAGARAEGELSADIGGAEASAKGDIGAGIGADVKAEVGFDDGKVEFGFGAHGYLGIGGGGEVSFEVDVQELAGNAVDFGKGAVNVGGTAFHKGVEIGENVADKVGDFGGDAVDGAKKAWDKVTPW